MSPLDADSRVFYGPSVAPGPYPATDSRISISKVDRMDIGPGCNCVRLTLDDGRIYKYEGHNWPTSPRAEWTPDFIPEHLRPVPFKMEKRRKR